MLFESAESYARALDSADPLAASRTAFALPRDANGEPLAYLCGQSLGLAPLAARTLVLEELQDWEQLGVLGHEQARRPWIAYAELLQRDLAMLAGAQVHEVVAMNSLTANLHLLLAGFYRPTQQRHRILIEAGAFSSDRHMVTSQLRWHGLDPACSLIELAPRGGEDLLRIEDIEACIAAEGDALALVLWPGVQYRTGQAFDMARLAAMTHAAGALLCLDLAHAIGNIPLALHDWNVDCAAWCSYKYLNGGPGAIAGAFIHQRHAGDTHLTRLEGWWGNERASRLQLRADFVASPGAEAWQLSNPPILATAPLLASLAQFRGAGIAALRAKSLRLTGYLEFLLQQRCGDSLQVVTSPLAAERGCQLSVRVRGTRTQARALFDTLLPRGVVADWREPGIIRLAPVPLYNSFHDVWRAVDALCQ
jgi:kynureninase